MTRCLVYVALISVMLNCALRSGNTSALSDLHANAAPTETGLVNEGTGDQTLLLLPVTVSVPSVRGFPVLAVYYWNEMLQPEQSSTQVIVAIWMDGLVVWSTNETTGGPPYFRAHISMEQVTNVLSEMGQFCVDNREVLRARLRLFDDAYVAIISNAEPMCAVTSAHEVIDAASVDADFLDMWSQLKELAIAPTRTLEGELINYTFGLRRTRE